MKLDREDLRLWLAAKDPDEIVGTPLSAEGCVLANYMEERTGEKHVFVPFMHWYSLLPEGMKLHHPPRWASRLGVEFDHLTDPPTAKNVLTLLDDLEIGS